MRRTFRHILFLILPGCAITDPGPQPFLIRPSAHKGGPSLMSAPTSSHTDELETNALAVPEKLSYQTNSHGSVALTLGAFGLSGSISRPFTPEDTQAGEKGTSTGVDYQFHMARGAFGLDAAWQEFKGFYGDPQKENVDEVHYDLRPDMKMSRRTLSLYLLSHPEDFQYNAAFNQSEFSNESGWTLIGMIAGDQTLISGLPWSTASDGSRTTAALEFRTLGLLVGAGLRGFLDVKNFLGGLFGSIAVSVGPAIQFGTISEGSKSQISTTKYTYKTNARFAIGIDKGRWFLGTSFWGDTSQVPNETFELNLSSSQIESFAGVRF